MASKANPLVIVPGILGSELKVAGAIVWAGDRRALHTILNPSYLLSWLPANAETLLSTYDDFITNFLESTKGYQRGFDLFVFAYDWRVGIQAAANALARYINDRVQLAHGGPLVFIAHSLGCLVVRWAIIKGLIDSQRIELVVAAGPPSLGSAKAFRSMVEMPNLNDSFDRMYELAERVWPTLAKRIETSLTKSLMALTSLLELMPPRNLPILRDGSPQLFSAFEWPGWPEALSSLRNRVENTQADLLSSQWPPSVPRKLIASEETPTETAYLFDSHSPFGIIASSSDMGDGRVWIDSARDFGTDEKELLVKSKHDCLLDDPDVRNWLDQRF